MPTVPPPPEYDAAAVQSLAARGVILPRPDLVCIARDVPLEQIEPGAVLYPFCRLAGSRTAVGAGASIGKAGPATLEDSAIGPGAVMGDLGPVTLRGVTAGAGTVLGCGVAEQAVFLGQEAGGATYTTGYGFRVRKGTLYEEDANSAQHTDVKMTILLPWVTLGSNLNWCDILVAGGVGPGLGEFTEVGSGAIHFNFTPRGDKATASLLGSVVEGVFLDRPRLFIGGNASFVGPLTAEFGAVTLAGSRHTRALASGLNAPEPAAAPADFDLEAYGSLQRVFVSQVRYIGELAALDAWYGQVRHRVAGPDGRRQALYAQGRAVVRANLQERIAQLEGLAGRMPGSMRRLEQRHPGDARIAQQRAFSEGWSRARAALERAAAAPAEAPAPLLAALDQGLGREPAYTRVIRGLPGAAKAQGREWLKRIRDAVAAPQVLACVPPLQGRAPGSR